MADSGLTFGLVHGGSHGGWCWERVIGELDHLGHRGIAMDLPCGDEDAGVNEYTAVVVDALADVDGPVVLVGHSLAGLTLPVVATARPVSRMIFLACILPVIGTSFREQREVEPDILFPRTGGREGLKDRFYNNCTPEDANWAWNQIRYQSERPRDEITPLRSWPAVPRDYLICTEDHACNPAWSRRAVPERLGVEPIEIAGSDHSPFISRPKELTDLLVDLARR